jgi:hypothetical protein
MIPKLQNVDMAATKFPICEVLSEIPRLARQPHYVTNQQDNTSFIMLNKLENRSDRRCTDNDLARGSTCPARRHRLPLSRPTYNGGLERGNLTSKEEFYYRCDLFVDTIGAMRFELKKALNKYIKCHPLNRWER